MALSYAEETKLPLLANKVRVRPSAFRVVRPEQRVQLAQMIHDAVVPVVAQLADHGVTAATLTSLQAAVDAAQRVLSAPREATVSRRAATEQLRDAFRAVDAVVENHFEPLLFPLKETHPEFYRRYKAARMIVDRTGGRSGSGQVEPVGLKQAALAPAAQPLAA